MSVALDPHDRRIGGPNVVVTDLPAHYQKERDGPDLISPGLSELGCIDLNAGMTVVFGEVIGYEVRPEIEEGGYGRQSTGFASVVAPDRSGRSGVL